MIPPPTNDPGGNDETTGVETPTLLERDQETRLRADNTTEQARFMEKLHETARVHAGRAAKPNSPGTTIPADTPTPEGAAKPNSLRREDIPTEQPEEPVPEEIFCDRHSEQYPACKAFQLALASGIANAIAMLPSSSDLQRSQAEALHRFITCQGGSPMVEVIPGCGFFLPLFQMTKDAVQWNYTSKFPNKFGTINAEDVHRITGVSFGDLLEHGDELHDDKPIKSMYQMESPESTSCGIKASSRPSHRYRWLHEATKHNTWILNFIKRCELFGQLAANPNFFQNIWDGKDRTGKYTCNWETYARGILNPSQPMTLIDLICPAEMEGFDLRVIRRVRRWGKAVPMDYSNIQVCAYNNKTWRAQVARNKVAHPFPKVFMMLSGTEYSSNEEVSHFTSEGSTDTIIEQNWTNFFLEHIDNYQSYTLAMGTWAGMGEPRRETPKSNPPPLKLGPPLKAYPVDPTKITRTAIDAAAATSLKTLMSKAKHPLPPPPKGTPRATYADIRALPVKAYPRDITSPLLSRKEGPPTKAFDGQIRTASPWRLYHDAPQAKGPPYAGRLGVTHLRPKPPPPSWRVNYDDDYPEITIKAGPKNPYKAGAKWKAAPKDAIPSIYSEETWQAQHMWPATFQQSTEGNMDEPERAGTEASISHNITVCSCCRDPNCKPWLFDDNLYGNLGMCCGRGGWHPAVYHPEKRTANEDQDSPRCELCLPLGPWAPDTPQLNEAQWTTKMKDDFWNISWSANNEEVYRAYKGKCSIEELEPNAAYRLVQELRFVKPPIRDLIPEELRPYMGLNRTKDKSSIPYFEELDNSTEQGTDCGIVATMTKPNEGYDKYY